MARIGMLPLIAFSHVQSMVCLALELKKRGHEVIFFGMADLENYLKDYTQFRVRTFAEEDFPRGSIERMHQEHADMSELQGLRHTISCIQSMIKAEHRYAPEVIKKENLDILISNELMGVIDAPIALLSSALLSLPDTQAPPTFTSRRYSNTWIGRCRIYTENLFLSLLWIPALRIVNKQRDTWGLPTCITHYYCM